MNRRLFLNTTMGLASFSIWSPFKKKEPYSKELLLGMCKLPLFSDTIPLNQEAGEAFIEMQNAALKQGVFLEIVSGYRSYDCLLYTSPSPRDRQKSRMPSSA